MPAIMFNYLTFTFFQLVRQELLLTPTTENAHVSISSDTSKKHLNSSISSDTPKHLNISISSDTPENI